MIAKDALVGAQHERSRTRENSEDHCRGDVVLAWLNSKMICASGGSEQTLSFGVWFLRNALSDRVWCHKMSQPATIVDVKDAQNDPETGYYDEV